MPLQERSLLKFCVQSSLSVGLYASVSSKEPISAGLLGVLLLLPFWLADIIADTVQVLG